MTATLTQALIVADSSWHSTRNLLSTWPPASQDSAPLLRFEPIDWQNARARGIKPWNWGVHSTRISNLETLVTAELPPGWMKSFPKLGQWPLAKAARNWLKQIDKKPLEKSLWITYPFYLELASQLKPDRLVYYNLDDYTLYWPQKADLVRLWVARTIEKSNWTICVAAERARQLRQTFPNHAHKILHVPHSAPEWTIPDQPFYEPGPLPRELKGIPRPILGYLGGLEDRLDWSLLIKIADRFPDASLVLVGPKPSLVGDEAWQLQARELLARLNVYAPGGVSQLKIGNVYASFSVNLIPYLTTHPFNHVCSPTKILDSMGSGRPTVTTALPESQIYRRLYQVEDSHDGFCDQIEILLKNDCRDGLEQTRWKYAFSRRSAVVMDALYRLTWEESLDDAHRVLESVSPIG